MDSKLKCVFDYVEDSEGNVESAMGGNVSPVMFNIFFCAMSMF